MKGTIVKFGLVLAAAQHFAGQEANYAPDLVDRTKLLALVVNGFNLQFAIQDHPQVFLTLVKACSVCICCRTSPIQKSQIVKYVRRKLRVITAAIGDGANDVSMIQSAHVGIGISGNEGMQAVRSADYAIGQFSFLQRLILVHGRYGYRRITSFVCYYFYKNITVALCELWFAMYSGFSGQLFFADYLSLSYNALWSSWAVLANGIFDQDMPPEACIAYPELYYAGPTNQYFNGGVFFMWVITALYHSLIGFFLPMFTLENNGGTSDGLLMGVWHSSTASFTYLMVVVSLRLALETHNWTIIHHVALWGVQLAFYFVSIIALCTQPLVFMSANWKLYDVIFRLAEMPSFWLLFINLPVLCLVPCVIYRYVKHHFQTERRHVIVENIALYGGSGLRCCSKEKSMAGDSVVQLPSSQGAAV